MQRPEAERPGRRRCINSGKNRIMTWTGTTAYSGEKGVRSRRLSWGRDDEKPVQTGWGVLRKRGSKAYSKDFKGQLER